MGSDGQFVMTNAPKPFMLWDRWRGAKWEGDVVLSELVAGAACIA